jgi:hypothetical protein
MPESLNQAPLSTLSPAPSSSSSAVKIVGLYGFTASGRTTMIQQLQTTEDFGGEETEANFNKGSAELQKPSLKKSLEAFKTSRGSQETVTRGLACQGYRVETGSLEGNTMPIVAGHYSFRDDKRGQSVPVWAAEDGKTSTYILHLATVPAEIKIRSKRALVKIYSPWRWHSTTPGRKESCESCRKSSTRTCSCAW